MSKNQFISKYPLEALVEFQINKDTDPHNHFGFIREVTFFKSDAVNYATYYSVELVNSQEMIRSVSEHNIVKEYKLL